MSDSDHNAVGDDGSPKIRPAAALTVVVFIICVLAVAAITAINTYFGGAVVDGETARTLIAIMVSVALATLIYTLFDSTTSALDWNIPGGPIIKLTGAGALAAAFYFLVVSQFNPTTHVNLLVSRPDGRAFENVVGVYFRLGGMFYTSVYNPSQRAVSFFYLPKSSELEVGVDGDTYVVEKIGDRTDDGCNVSDNTKHIIKLSSDCDSVEILLIGRGSAENVGVGEVEIGAPSGAFVMSLGDLLERYPFRRIRSEFQRLEAPTQLEVLYRPPDIEAVVHTEKLQFNLTEDGNKPACSVLSEIFNQYRRDGSLTGLDFHVSKRTITIYSPDSKPESKSDCRAGG